jgi:hypothetical protein
MSMVMATDLMRSNSDVFLVLTLAIDCANRGCP